jgi:tight adherence protein B
VSGVCVLLAGAALLWPGRRPLDVARLGVGGGLPDRRARVVSALARLPVPWMAGCAGALAAALLSTGLVAAVTGVCAAAAGRAWAARRRAAAQAADVASLAEGLAALGAELRSGRSLEAAAGVAASACADVRCGRALALAVRVPEAGRSRTADDAEDGTTPADAALARISAAVLLSRRSGCSLAAVLAAVEDDLRARLRHSRELASAIAGPRASAVLLAGLPLLGLAMGNGVGARPWHVLTATGPGEVLLVVGVGLELAGIAWSARLVQRAVR